MPFGNLARGLAKYKGAKFGLRTLFRHPLLALALGAGALWYRKRSGGGRRRGGLLGGFGDALNRGGYGGSSMRRGGSNPEHWAR